MAYEINGKDLPNVSRETINKSANLLILNMPRSDADNAWVFDFMGVTLNISVEGTCQGAEIAQFLTDFYGGTALTGGFVDGTQDNSTTYTGSNNISVDVIVTDIVTNVAVQDTEDILRYTVKMVMGKGGSD